MHKYQLENLLNQIRSVVIDTQKGIQRKEVLTDRVYSLIKVYPRLNRLLEQANRIWLGSDWHLWNYLNFENDFKNQLILNQIKMVKTNDVFIYLGDFAHRLSTQPNLQEKLKVVIQNLMGKLVMVQGNHDIFETRFYKEAGFLEVNDGFIWRDLVFSHAPINIDRFPGVQYNIHGHTHNFDHPALKDHNLVVYSRNYGNQPVLLENVLPADYKF